MPDEIPQIDEKCDEETIAKDELILNLISRRNDAEFERNNILDNKASGIIGFAGIIIGLLGTIISFLLDKLTQGSSLLIYYNSYRVILLFGILFLAAAIILCCYAYSIKVYTIVPKTDMLIENYARDKKKNKCTVIRVVGQEISLGILKNAAINDEKAKCVKYGLRLYAFGMALTVLFFIGLLMV